MSDSMANPYLGPRTFEERHAHLFFGRDREARDLLATVISEPLVLFYAPSGAGKSSLINTRLIPGLREEGFFVMPVGRIGGTRSFDGLPADNIFIHNLLASINQGQIVEGDLPYTSLTAFIRLTRETMEDPGQPLVLIVDQFEELVTSYHGFWHQRDSFFDQLNQALEADSLLWIVLSLREDYLAAIEPYARALPGRLLAHFQMQRMRAPAALDAISQPAADHQRPFAEGVATRLVDNLRQIRTHEAEGQRLGEFVEPVQLQVVCYQLWENLKSRPLGEITASDVDELGDVDQALGDFYQRTIREVLVECELTELELRSWFEHKLITEDNTRGTVYQGPEETAGLPNEAVRRLADRYLLRSELRAGGAWYELVHDRLVSPILQSNTDWREAQGPLLAAAETWRQANDDPALLLEGNLLREALANLDPSTTQPLVMDFLSASQVEQEHRAQERNRKLAEAEAEAARQKQRADEQARTSRRLRLLSGGLLVVFLLALGLGIFAAVQAGEADRQRREANRQSQKADEVSEALSTQVSANLALATAAASDDLEAAATAQAIANAAATSVANAEAELVAVRATVDADTEQPSTEVSEAVASATHEAAAVASPVATPTPRPTRDLITVHESSEKTLGMDVSQAQGDRIDFDRAAEAGVRFVIIRAGSGRNLVDSNYEPYFAAAGERCMLRGINYRLYPESRATVGDPADRTPEGQARRFASLLHRDAELGAFVDVQEDGLTVDEVRRFVEEFQEHDPYGRPITIYTGNWFWHAAQGFAGENVAWAREHPLWIAQYTSGSEPITPSPSFEISVPEPWQNYVFHQWTNLGGPLVDQVVNNLFLDYFIGGWPDLREWAQFSVAKPQGEFETIGAATVSTRISSLFQEPSAESCTVNILVAGNAVEVIQLEGDWALVRHGDEYGYLRSSDLGLRQQE